MVYAAQNARTSLHCVESIAHPPFIHLDRVCRTFNDGSTICICKGYVKRKYSADPDPPNRLTTDGTKRASGHRKNGGKRQYGMYENEAAARDPGWTGQEERPSRADGVTWQPAGGQRKRGEAIYSTNNN
jgi:hypothetical protein